MSSVKNLFEVFDYVAQLNVKKSCGFLYHSGNFRIENGKINLVAANAKCRNLITKSVAKRL